MEDWTVRDSGSTSDFQYTSETMTSSSSLSSQQVLCSSIPFSKNVYSSFSDFCTEENIEQGISYLDQELTTFGFPSLYEESKGEETKKELNIFALLNCMNELLVLQQKNLLARENMETQNLKLRSKMDHLQKCSAKLRDQLETYRWEMVELRERYRQLQFKNRDLSQQLKSEKGKVQKIQNIMASRAVQYNHELKEKEREYNKLKEQMQQLMDKKAKKMSTDILNSVGKDDGKQHSGRSGKTEPRNEEEMHRTLSNENEHRQKPFVKENYLKKVLQQMKKEIMSPPAPQKKKPEDRADSGTDAALSGSEDDAAESSWNLPCDSAREPFTESICKEWNALNSHVEKLEGEPFTDSVWKQRNALKSHEEKLESQVAEVHVEGLSREDLISLPDNERETENLKGEIQQCKEMIKTQEQIIQQQPAGSGSCDDDTASLLRGSYSLEEEERLREGWPLFKEQKKNFESEQQRFTEATIPLGLQREVFKERASWLKQPQNPENVKPFSALSGSPDPDNLTVHPRPWQNKPCSVAPACTCKLPASFSASDFCQIGPRAYEYGSVNRINRTAEETKPNEVGSEWAYPKWRVASRPGSREGCYRDFFAPYPDSTD